MNVFNRGFFRRRHQNYCSKKIIYINKKLIIVFIIYCILFKFFFKMKLFNSFNLFDLQYRDRVHF